MSRAACSTQEIWDDEAISASTPDSGRDKRWNGMEWTERRRTRCHDMKFEVGKGETCTGRGVRVIEWRPFKWKTHCNVGGNAFSCRAEKKRPKLDASRASRRTGSWSGRRRGEFVRA